VSTLLDLEVESLLVLIPERIGTPRLEKMGHLVNRDHRVPGNKGDHHSRAELNPEEEADEGPSDDALPCKLHQMRQHPQKGCHVERHELLVGENPT